MSHFWSIELGTLSHSLCRYHEEVWFTGFSRNHSLALLSRLVSFLCYGFVARLICTLLTWPAESKGRVPGAMSSSRTSTVISHTSPFRPLPPLFSSSLVILHGCSTWLCVFTAGWSRTFVSTVAERRTGSVKSGTRDVSFTNKRQIR